MRNGILIIDKEKDITSRDVVNALCRKFGTKKIGHTGTLDPIATGVLVLGINEGTKLIEFLMSDEKEYIAEVLIGVETDTLDVTGKVISEKQVSLEETTIKNALLSFVGSYEQEVPKYSAVHVDGKRLYEYARSDEEVNLPKRKVEIREIELLEVKKNAFTFRVVVSKGTYIRSLIRDIGTFLGVACCMKNLRRTRQGIFAIDRAKKLDEVSEQDILPLISGLENYPKYVVEDEDLFKVLNGAKLKKDYSVPCTMVDSNNNLLAIYENAKEEGYIKPKKVFRNNL